MYQLFIRIKKDIGRHTNVLNLRMREMVFDSAMYKIDVSVLIDSEMIWVDTAKKSNMRFYAETFRTKRGNFKK